jgi:hypothetical protein
MRYYAQISAFLLIASALSLAEVGKSSRKPVQRSVAQVPPVQQQEPVAPPPRPLTPEEMPATAPNVGMNSGMLTIAAENSTLGDVLTAVHRATGAAIDVPPAAGSERVVVHLGPGQPRDVIGSLLSGSKFDYIIVGSPQNANAVQRVILTARSGGNVSPTPVNNSPNAGVGGRPAPAYQPPPEEAYQPPDDVNAEDDAPDHPEPSPEIPEVTMPAQQQPGAPGAPGQPPSVPGPINQSPNQPQNQNGPKTPEQLLQELQQLQQQQQQQQQQGNQPQPR